MVDPRREEGVNCCRVDQLSVIGKYSPKKNNNELNET